MFILLQVVADRQLALLDQLLQFTCVVERPADFSTTNGRSPGICVCKEISSTSNS